MLTGPMTARRSNASNAYDLMTDVADYILEEPQRIYMSDWLIQGQERIKAELGRQGPECGTVGCIAGNVRVLTGQVDVKKSTYTVAIDTLSAGQRVLEDYLYELFHDTEVNAKYGTKKYARIVAKRIADFQKEHGDALRAVKVN